MECDYYPYVKRFKDKKYGTVLTFNWEYTGLTIEGCNKLLEEFEYRNERFIEITKTLIDELARTRRPTRNQIDYVNTFTRLHEDWIVHDPDRYIKMFNDTFYLDRLVELIIYFLFF